jgi:hypothetical protein
MNTTCVRVTRLPRQLRVSRRSHEVVWANEFYTVRTSKQRRFTDFTWPVLLRRQYNRISQPQYRCFKPPWLAKDRELSFHISTLLQRQSTTIHSSTARVATLTISTRPHRHDNNPHRGPDPFHGPRSKQDLIKGHQPAITHDISGNQQTNKGIWAQAPPHGTCIYQQPNLVT